MEVIDRVVVIIITFLESLFFFLVGDFLKLEIEYHQHIEVAGFFAGEGWALFLYYRGPWKFRAIFTTEVKDEKLNVNYLKL